MLDKLRMLKVKNEKLEKSLFLNHFLLHSSIIAIFRCQEWDKYNERSQLNLYLCIFSGEVTTCLFFYHDP